MAILGPIVSAVNKTIVDTPVWQECPRDQVRLGEFSRCEEELDSVPITGSPSHLLVEEQVGWGPRLGPHLTWKKH